MYRLLSINIYPVKSLGGVSLEQAFACKAGLRFDRRWMLVDDNGVFVSQRTNAQLALFGLSLSHECIQVQYNGETIKFHAAETEGRPFETTVWDDSAWAVEVNETISQWFTEKLSKKVRLVKMMDEDSRLHHSSVLDQNIPVSFADAYPYLITGTQSLQLLNEKLSISVPMNRFRPNLVISTSRDHEEDNWGSYLIGEAKFRSLKPCGRCQVITIDQHTGQTNPEPLTVLNSYRRQGQSVMFGAHTICLREGEIKVGDSVSFE